MNMFTAQQIRELRRSLGLNTTQFATALGVTENAVRRWEIGDRHPRFATVVKLNEMADSTKKTATASA